MELLSTNTVIFFGLVIQFSTNPVTTERRTRSGSLSPVNCCLKRNLGDKVTTKKLSTFNSWKVMRIKNNPKPTKLFQGSYDTKRDTKALQGGHQWGHHTPRGRPMRIPGYIKFQSYHIFLYCLRFIASEIQILSSG